MTSSINSGAESARESARQADGKFGAQEHAEPTAGTAALTSTSKVYPTEETRSANKPVRVKPMFTNDLFWDEDANRYTMVFEAESFGEPWNGFVTPVVTRRVAEAFASASLTDETAATYNYQWEGDTLVVWNPEERDLGHDVSVRLSPDERGNYDLAPLGFTLDQHGGLDDEDEVDQIVRSVPTWLVRYEIRSGIDDGLVKQGEIPVLAATEDAAYEAARGWVHDNDTYADPRIDPYVDAAWAVELEDWDDRTHPEEYGELVIAPDSI